MKKIWINILVAAGLIGLVPAVGVTAPAGQQKVSHPHTSVRLIADVRSVQPGSRFTVGLVMTMEPGWHTYWSNPGESGLPTKVRWTLPDGLRAGATEWPIPERHIEAGDVLTYGYQGETMLLFPMKASASLIPGTSVTLKAEASWLECKEICIPGDGTASLTLPVSSNSPEADHQAVFGNYASKLPSVAARTTDIILTTGAHDREVTIRLRPSEGRRFVVATGSIPDFYPEPLDAIMVGRTTVRATPDSAELAASLTASEPVNGPDTLRGVVVYQLQGGGKRGVEVEIPLTAQFCTGLSQSGGTSTNLLDRPFLSVQSTGGRSLLLYIAFAVLGGILLNIMPCVLPVIALKIFGLVRMAGDEPRKVRTLGVFFSLGILAAFLVLAAIVIILQAAGQQVGWGFQFQEPLFVIAMSAIVLAFGLSLFGVFEIRLPAAAVSAVGEIVSRQEGKGKGYASSFSEGVFATILATPCTAPFLGAALGFAFAQPAWVILLIFFSVALGMALPYLLLTSRPGWLKFLPKPGGWMETAKQFMGFLMLATLLWLLYVLGMQLGVEAIIWTCAFLLTVALACWIVGRYATLTAGRGRVITTWASAVVLIAAGYWIFLGSILDIRSAIAGVESSSSDATAEIRRDGIPWQPFSLTSLESYLNDGKPVFIDFTAEWCLTCKVNEKAVMADSKVVEKFKSSDIIPIRADWTNRNPDITRLLAKFGRSGVPLYVLFPVGRPTEPIVLPEVISTGIVIDAIDRATAPAKAALD